MTRYLSAAGLAVYMIAVSTAFPSVQDAWSSLGGLVPAAIAAEAAPETAATTEAPSAAAAPAPAAGAAEWDADRDGMLMDETHAEPFSILNPA